MAMPRPNNKASKIARNIIKNLGGDAEVNKKINRKNKTLNTDVPTIGATEKGNTRDQGPYG